MQDRYTGDIGDFGKLGLLRWLSTSLSIGVNWYLVPDESHNGDGRHTNYLKKSSFQLCDPDLCHSLEHIVNSGQRRVTALENASILSAVFYSDVLNFNQTTKPKRKVTRTVWHQNAINRLKDCDLIFLDPDNGLMVPSAEDGPKSNKYVLPSELVDYYCQGSSVLYYQHKARLPDEFYFRQHRQLVDSGEFPDVDGMCLKFISTSQRFYFFLLQPKHIASVTVCIEQMMTSPWSQFFQYFKKFK